MKEIDKIKSVAQQLHPSILNPQSSILTNRVSTILSRGISIDSRKIKPGNVFVAIKGENFDGHDYVMEAKERGASALIVEREMHSGLPEIVVENTVHALGKIASSWRKKFTLPVVALTGSNGKTTVKTLLESILNEQCDHDDSAYLVTQGNLNNEIGVPLNLFNLNEHHRYAVLEMGMNHFGEIERLTHIAKPNVVLITNAYPSHLAGVGNSVEGVAKAKGEIFQGLSQDGFAILNRESPFFDYWYQLSEKHHHLTFGLTKKADIFAKDLTLDIDQTQFVLVTPKGERDIHLSLFGQHNVENALAAAAVALALNIDIDVIKKGLESAKPYKRRLNFYALKIGAILIDDTYNANPASTKAAIDLLVKSPGEKILVLGDMRELGIDEIKYHQEIGVYAKNAGINQLMTVGSLMLHAVNAFGIHAEHFSSHEALIAELLPRLKEDVTVLVKGSFSMNMNKITEALLER